MATVSQSSQSVVYWSDETTTAWRYDHMLQPSKIFDRDPVAQSRMIPTPDEHIALIEQMPGTKTARRILRRHERQVDIAARHLSLQLRRVEIAERHPHSGCNRPELLDERLDHCHLQVVRTGDSDDQLGLGRVEVPVGCNSGTNLIEGLTQRVEQFDGLGGRRHSTLHGNEQRIVEQIPQAAQLSTDCWLAQVQAGRRLGYVPLHQQRLQCDQQIKIKTFAIHEMDSSRKVLRFHL